MRKVRIPVAAVAAALLIAARSFGSPAPVVGKQAGVANKVIARQLAVELGQAKMPPHIQWVSSGTMYAAYQASGVLQARVTAGVKPPTLNPSDLGTQGCHNTIIGTVTDVRVNQDCSLRRQAEEVIAVNPTNPKNLIAGQNDSRIGYNHCGYDWSFDGGATWGDQIPPFYQTALADEHVADACSDPTAAFDAQGNAYIGGVLFDALAAPSAVMVAKSNAPIGGAFYHSTVPGPFQTYSDTPIGVVASDSDPNIANDKELLTADANSASPKANNVYITWTRFNFATGAGVGADSPIYFSQSTDGGATWSAGIEISGSNTTFCTAGSGESDPNACDQDQGSQPIVAPDGTVYVAFGNGNAATSINSINQHMVVSCAPTKDCSLASSWRPPVKITDDFTTQPVGPDTDTACAAGRQCLPPNGYRLDDFVEGSISSDSTGNLYFAWADYRNGQSSTNCPGLSDAASDTPPCNNDVFYSFSTDKGRTWSAASVITPPSVFGQTAQWQPWSAVSQSGKTLYVAFYDRHYGNCETTGCNDITLATIRNPGGSSPTFSYQRLTNRSFPNLVVANNPVEAGFLGDYMWVTVGKSGPPYVVWAGTNGLGGSVEEDIYFAR